jgi:DNA polymerase III subunit delta
VSAAVTLVRGDDASLVRDAVRRVIDDAVGDGDRSLLVDEFSGEEYECGAVVDAARTPPFLTDRRIVVARDLHRFKADELTPLVAYLGDPLDTTQLVLVWEQGAVPKGLLDAFKKAGGVQVDTSPGRSARDQRSWLTERIAESGVQLDKGAVDLVATTLGEDLDRLGGLLATLRSTYGEGARLGPDDVEPYLGGAGGVAPWELTDAIDRGDIGGAVERLHRLLGGGERHPMVVLATLHNHVSRLLALDGADVRGDKEAAELLGMRGSTFPAKKALDQSRRLGPAKVARAVELVAQADLDLRGVKDWPSELVLEVLVARLAALGGRR